MDLLYALDDDKLSFLQSGGDYDKIGRASCRERV